MKRLWALFPSAFLATALLVSIVPSSAHAQPGTTGSWIVTRLSTQPGAYTVVGKTLSGNVARAVIAIQRCEMKLGEEACAGLLGAIHQTESALVRRGRDALAATEPAESDPFYASIPVVVAPAGNSSSVFTAVPASASFMAVQRMTGVSRLKSGGISLILHRHTPLSHSYDGGTIPTTWHSCDGTWCYGYTSTTYSPAGAGWSMFFDFNVKVPQAYVKGPIWGSGWYVGGSGVLNHSMCCFSYSNQANGDHSEIWPVAHGTETFSVGGGQTQLAVTISEDLAWNLNPWSWTGTNG